MEPIFCPVQKCPIIYIDSGVEKCESGFANSIIPVPLEYEKAESHYRRLHKAGQECPPIGLSALFYPLAKA